MALPPRLLVSVRNLAEARAALSGGCDIIDVKEPKRGSLGMADVETMGAIMGDIRTADAPAPVPVSAALGELTEWDGSKRVPAVPAGLDFLKLGPAGTETGAEWSRRWRQVRRKFEEASRARFRWIAVAYADWRQARAPHPEDVLERAIAGGCHGLLVDTHRKNDQTLLCLTCPEELYGLARRLHDAGRIFAIAGRLCADHLPGVMIAKPDILGIRTAGCRNRQRFKQIDAEAVRDFKAAIHQSLSSNSIWDRGGRGWTEDKPRIRGPGFRS